MYEYISNGYRFIGLKQGTVMVYKEMMYITSFNVHHGINSKEALTRESEQYLKNIKQKY